MAIKFVDRTTAEGEPKLKKSAAPRPEEAPGSDPDPSDGALPEPQSTLLDLALPKTPAKPRGRKKAFG